MPSRKTWDCPRSKAISQKKLRSGQFGLSRRRLKRPCNHLLSTGNCYYQASEEESLSNLLIRAGFLAEHPATGGRNLFPLPYAKLTERRGIALQAGKRIVVSVTQQI